MESSKEPVERVRGLKPGDLLIRRRRFIRHRLRRAVGVPGLFSSAYGNVGSSIYYALGVTALYALGLTPAVFLLAGLLFALTAMSYAEGTAAMPEAGGSSSFARHAFNELISFLAGWALMLDYIITIAISAFEVPNYLAIFWDPLKTYPLNSIGGVAVVAFLVWINILGIREAATVNVVLSVIDLVTQIIIAAVGIVFLFSPAVLVSNVHLGVAPTWGQLLYAIPVATIAYTGIETVSNMAEEAKDPGRDVPRAVALVFAAVLSLYMLISVIALSAMPVVQRPDGTWMTDLGDKWKLDPVMGVVSNFPGILRTVLSIWVGILAATILFIATNAGILGISRLTYSMGQHQQVPQWLSKVHPTHRTPWVSIITFGVLASLLIVPGKIELLADVYAFGAMLAFTFAHASIFVLRMKAPGMARPYKAPLSVTIGGREVALTALIGGIGTLTVWLVVVATHELARWVGIPWVLAGFVMYYFYRRRRGLPLTKTVKVET